MTKPTGKVVHYTEVPAQTVGDTAPGASIRWLVDDDHDGAPVYALRMIEIEPGGHSPHHSHNYEHENFVVEGKGQLFITDTWHDLYPGVVCFVPPNAEHEFRNTGDTPLKFLCGIPVKKLLGV
ncbi:MAG: cupin domain-containing protein [Anaerolineaceae bacterium]|nr:cupin domain-containing protein [Anaerolineaceae bacterium]